MLFHLEYWYSLRPLSAALIHKITNSISTENDFNADEIVYENATNQTHNIIIMKTNSKRKNKHINASGFHTDNTTYKAKSF